MTRQIARSSYWLVAAGDIACFLAFAVIGLRNHEETFSAGNILRAGGPFLVCWLVSAGALGLLSEPTPLPTNKIIRRVVAAWLPAWVVGLLGRSLLFGRPFVPAFAIVALLVNGALLLLWRTAWSDLARRKLMSGRGGRYSR